jgi:hypothetical protein
VKSTLPCSTPALLHPVTLLALALWAINDHVLKGWGPGGLTGKLSDVTALVVCPVVLLGIVEWQAPKLVRQHLGAALACCCGAIGLLLAGLELSAPVELAYQHTLASAQHAVRSLAALASGSRLPNYVLVQTTPDVTDLFTLPALAVPWCLSCAAKQARVVRQQTLP